MIVSYPRDVDSVRKTDDKRKLKRQERAEKKQLEKTHKEEELKKIKNVKKKEVLTVWDDFLVETLTKFKCRLWINSRLFNRSLVTEIFLALLKKIWRVILLCLSISNEASFRFL